MNGLPDKLFEMAQRGEDEEEVQEIFDYLLEAEATGHSFVNVYRTSDQAFFRTRYRAEADEQLRKWREYRGTEPDAREAIGFWNLSGDWRIR